jgi:hypothetical protein
MLRRHGNEQATDGPTDRGKLVRFVKRCAPMQVFVSEARCYLSSRRQATATTAVAQTPRPETELNSESKEMWLLSAGKAEAQGAPAQLTTTLITPLSGLPLAAASSNSGPPVAVSRSQR